MASCVGNIAGNIGLNCDHPIEGGYTGRGILIPLDSNPIFTVNADNPRIIESVSFDGNETGKKYVYVDNEGINPYDGSSTTGNNDAGFVKFVKTVAIRMPERGAHFAKDVLEPLVKSGRGFVGIFEKIDRAGDGSFEVIGYYNPLKVVDPSTVTRQETANGGAWLATLQSTEIYSEVVLFDTAYADTLSLFNAMVADALSAE